MPTETPTTITTTEAQRAASAFATLGRQAIERSLELQNGSEPEHGEMEFAEIMAVVVKDNRYHDHERDDWRGRDWMLALRYLSGAPR